MQAETLDILIERAHFEPEVAHAIGTAIETEVKAMQLVTEPVFRAAIAEVRGEIAEVRGEIAEVRGEIVQVRGEVAEVRGDVAKVCMEVASVLEQVAGVRSDVSQMETRFVWKLAGLIVIAFSIVIGALLAAMRIMTLQS